MLAFLALLMQHAATVGRAQTGYSQHQTGYTPHQRIICPFLSALINEGVLEVKSEYTQEELLDITIQAGLDPETAQGHIAGNFRNIPSGSQDIFNMEGAPNEHVTSTGINDCPTSYTKCAINAAGVWRCLNQTLLCTVPNSFVFEQFWNHVDEDGNGTLTVNELLNTAGTLPFVDTNPIAGGTIAGSFSLLIRVFGEASDQISKKSLQRVNVQRRFPLGYKFPGRKNRFPLGLNFFGRLGQRLLFLTEQGLCRDGSVHGGWCSCGQPQSASDCWAQASGWQSLQAAEFRTSIKQCALFHFLSSAPTNCPAGCLAHGGNGGNVVAYHGDGNSDNVCMMSLRQALAPFLSEQGLCRDDGAYGGWCSCGKPRSATDCWAQAIGWPSLKAVEYGASSNQCALFHFSSSAPTNCPAGCSAHAGSRNSVVAYHGDGNSDNVCMLPTQFV